MTHTLQTKLCFAVAVIFAIIPPFCVQRRLLKEKSWDDEFPAPSYKEIDIVTDMSLISQSKRKALQNDLADDKKLGQKNERKKDDFGNEKNTTRHDPRNDTFEEMIEIKLQRNGDERQNHNNSTANHSEVKSIKVKSSKRGLNAVIHVGPPKTGSTSLQTSMVNYRTLLQFDSYEVPTEVNAPGPRGDPKAHANIATCLSGKDMTPPCDPSFWDTFDSYLSDLAANRRNLLISAEGLSISSINYEKMVSLLEPWDVKIVVVYRRQFEWLLSKYFQLFRHCNDTSYPGVVEWISKDDLKNLTDSHTFKVADRYRAYFDDVSILNIHDTEDLIADFYCNLIPDTKRTCAYSKRRITRKLINEGDEIEYQRLVNMAFEKNLIRSNIPRAHAIEAARNRQEVTLNRTRHDFPRHCLSPDLQRQLLDSSLEGEKRLLPEWFARPHDGGETAIRSKFDVAAKTELCSADIDEILADDDWRRFFRELRRDPNKLIPRARKGGRCAYSWNKTDIPTEFNN